MRLFSILIFLFISGNLISQDNSLELDRVYGLNPHLYNGKKYTYFLPYGTGGNQFLESSYFTLGEITIKGKKFDGIAINYDVFNQQLLLEYTNETGTSDIIEVSKAWLESFRLGGKDFQLLDLGNGERFYQILGEGPVFILFFFRKDLTLEHTSRGSNYTFTPPFRSQFVLIGGTLNAFRKKRSLISIFDPGKEQEIKKYIKDRKLDLKKASDHDMTELINFINNL